MTGFVTIRGGKETKRGAGELPGAFAFCHQRRKVEATSLGPFTQFQASLTPNGMERLSRMTDNFYTMTASSFTDNGETLGIPYFKWLLQERGLEGFEISHLLWFPERNYLTPYFQDMLQRRRDIKRLGGSEMLALLYKMYVNGLYGIMATEARNFSTSLVVSEATMHNQKKALMKRFAGNVLQLTLLGAVEEKNDKPPSLLYAVTLKRPAAKILNLLQVSAAILNYSRLIFLSRVATLLKIMSPLFFSIAYNDTDSCISMTTHKDLAANLRPGVDPALLAAEFEDEESPIHQSGKWKLESVWSSARFRCPKCYKLENPSEAEKLSRMRGIPRKCTNLLEDRHFGQTPATNFGVVSSYALRPTLGMQMVLTAESRSLGVFYNTKRFAVVRERGGRREPNETKILFLSLLGSRP